MPSSSTSAKLNSELREKRDFFSLLDRDDLDAVVEHFNYNWLSNTFNAKSDLAKVFYNHGWINSDHLLTRIGILLYGRLALQFSTDDPLLLASTGNYALIECMHHGKNSSVFRAKHKVLGHDVVIKIVRPGASENLKDSLRKLASADLPENIIQPMDILDASALDAFGQEVKVHALVFPLIKGISFGEFLRQESMRLNPHLVSTFITQIGGALAALEKIGAYHGDLHERNIIVGTSPGGTIEFNLIDISFDAVGSLGLRDAQNTDLENFSVLIWRFLSEQKKSNPRISIRKSIGSAAYFPIEKLLANHLSSVSELFELFVSKSQYKTYLNEKSQFIEAKFRTPDNMFRLQRYEEFVDPASAALLFEPLRALQDKIMDFSNAYISGNRGCGKSTYLAMLGFFPRAAKTLVDPKFIFGVYFPCRQGDFRSLAVHESGSTKPSPEYYRHALVLKTVRRTLEVLSAAISSGALNQPLSLSAIRVAVNRVLPPPGIILAGSESSTMLDGIVSMVAEAEAAATSDPLYIKRSGSLFASEADLIRFFEAVREDFQELGSARFHLLFDDAGSPYVPRSVQKAICDLLVSSNSVFCVKFSAEKHTFILETSEGKVLEIGHDLFEHDISLNLFFGAGSTGITTTELEHYFRRIVDKRLEYFKHRGLSIVDYLGDEKRAYDKLMYKLMMGGRDAYYHGWHAVWNVADRTPRTLLEIISEIFSSAQIKPTSVPRVIPRRQQDTAIRLISEKRLQQLTQVSGVFSFGGRHRSLGKHLHDVATTIGAAFYAHLRQQESADQEGYKNPRQQLAIERNDIYDLNRNADFILRKLVTFGVLDSTKAFVSRDDGRKKSIYVLNRVFCPAFSIGYRRDDHLPLSGSKLELLLLSPDVFRKGGTEFLRKLADPEDDNLFGWRSTDES